MLSLHLRASARPRSVHRSCMSLLCSTAAPSGSVPPKYSPTEAEPKWQKFWQQQNSFKAPRIPGPRKKYILDMFPYPSGSGLHVGHPCGYTATDILARYWRSQGFDVLHPMGWDAFGLPAEQHAMNTGTHPAVTTKKNIDNFRKQLQSLGFSYDWSRELSTTDENYVKWTQWIFLRLFKKGLASQCHSSVNWCPALGTVLANEEVINGLSERGDHPVVRKPLRQWMLKITEYAGELSRDLNQLNWPEGTLAAQKQWIGKMDGTTVRFDVVIGDGTAGMNTSTSVDVFTTKVETLMGTTYIALAPEHPLVNLISANPESCSSTYSPAADHHQAMVAKYVEEATNKTDLERTIAVGKDKTKTGIELHPQCYAIHPITKAKLPIYVADYVLSGYGYSAVMGVPAHDERDADFAALFAIPSIKVMTTPTSNEVDATGSESPNKVFTDEELILCNSGDSLNGRVVKEGREIICRMLQDLNCGGNVTTMYRLKDWLFSRQRYWGEPIPIYYPVVCNGTPADGAVFDPRLGHEHVIQYDKPIAVDDADLPLKLPEMVDFQPMIRNDSHSDAEASAMNNADPEGCLARIHDWRYFSRTTETPSGPIVQWFARETNTMPQWAGSCWYYLRFMDPHNDDAIFDQEVAKAWLPVDVYVGGQEHAVLHLLYARFWHKVLFDLGIVPPEGSQVACGDNEKDSRNKTNTKLNLDEPFLKLVHQGMILGPDGEKMSKSKGNVISPDEIVSQYGGDVLRVYEMFMGPLTATKPWDNNKMVGISRFLNRVYALTVNFVDSEAQTGDVKISALTVSMNKAIEKVSSDIEALSFNTAISALMIYLNDLQKALNSSKSGDASNAVVCREHIEVLAILLSPFAPHLGEEIYEIVQRRFNSEYNSENSGGVSKVNWPQVVSADTLAAGGRNVDSVMVQIGVQVNGKFKCNVSIDSTLFGAEQGEPCAVAGEEIALLHALAVPTIQQSIANVLKRSKRQANEVDTALSLLQSVDEKSNTESLKDVKKALSVRRVIFVPGKVLNIIL